MTKLKKVIEKFKFKDVGGAHVALVDAAANAQEVLTLKQAPAQHDVQVTLPMKNFLKTFFGMYEDDAAVLAGIMGFEPNLHNDYVNAAGQILTVEELVQQRIDSVMLFKGMEIPELAPASIVTKIEELMNEFGDKLTLKGSPSGNNTDNGESKLVKKVEIDQAELDTMKSKLADAVSAKAELDTLKSAFGKMQEQLITKAKSEMAECIKGYSFIDEADQEAVSAVLLGMDDNSLIIKSLESARDAITAAASINQETGQEGGDAEIVDQADLDCKELGDMVSASLKARKV